MELKPLLTMRDTVKDPVDIGDGPHGQRMILDITGGSFTGEKLSGSILSSGGDWILVDDSGVAHLDVRITLKTEDDALIYMQYHGVLIMNEAVNEALAGGKPTEFGDTYFMTQPRFETGDERYQWLNNIVAIGEGRVLHNAAEYRIYELLND